MNGPSLRLGRVTNSKPGPFSVISHVRNVKRLIGTSLDSQSAHYATRSLMYASNAAYFSFNVTLNSKAWSLDSRTKSREAAFDRLDIVTNEYLEKVSEQLRGCAKVLVERRRLRSMDISAWQRFTLSKDLSRTQFQTPAEG